jgi:hypothetical protein
LASILFNLLSLLHSHSVSLPLILRKSDNLLGARLVELPPGSTRPNTFLECVRLNLLRSHCLKLRELNRAPPQFPAYAMTLVFATRGHENHSHILVEPNLHLLPLLLHLNVRFCWGDALIFL